MKRLPLEKMLELMAERKAGASIGAICEREGMTYTSYSRWSEWAAGEVANGKAPQEARPTAAAVEVAQQSYSPGTSTVPTYVSAPPGSNGYASQVRSNGVHETALVIPQLASSQASPPNDRLLHMYVRAMMEIDELKAQLSVQ